MKTKKKKISAKTFTGSEYTTYLPLMNELNTGAPDLPPHYEKAFSIDNSNNNAQILIGNSNYMNKEYFCYNNINNSSSYVQKPPHINVYILF